jgi:hypothetical protein
MAHDAKCGMMLWDGKGKGTLNNIQQIIGAGKKALVYLAPEKAAFDRARAPRSAPTLRPKRNSASSATDRDEAPNHRPDSVTGIDPG